MAFCQVFVFYQEKKIFLNFLNILLKNIFDFKMYNQISLFQN